MDAAKQNVSNLPITTYLMMLLNLKNYEAKLMKKVKIFINL